MASLKYLFIFELRYAKKDLQTFSLASSLQDSIKAWMSLNFGKIPLLTSELAALEHQKN